MRRRFSMDVDGYEKKSGDAIFVEHAYTGRSG